MKFKELMNEENMYSIGDKWDTDKLIEKIKDWTKVEKEIEKLIGIKVKITPSSIPSHSTSRSAMKFQSQETHIINWTSKNLVNKLYGKLEKFLMEKVIIHVTRSQVNNIKTKLGIGVYLEWKTNSYQEGFPELFNATYDIDKNSWKIG